MAMNLELLLVGVGLAFIIWLWAFTNQVLNSRSRSRSVDTRRVVPVNLLNNTDGVIVAEGRGHVVYMNDRIRQWFNLNEVDATLSVLASRVQPADIFHDLFAEEGRATLRVGLSRFEASSHIIPTTEGRRMVVFMQEIASQGEADEFDTSSALIVVQEISQTITQGVDLDHTLNTILNSIGRVISYDAGEITLWDPHSNGLRPIGRVGDTHYLKRHASNGGNGKYVAGDGYTGWIARYRQPLLLGNVRVRTDVQPQMEYFPYESYIGLPLVISDRFIGTLELVSSHSYAFDHEDLALLESVAGQAAIAIENARLATEQANRLLQLTGLQSIAQTMGDQDDSRELYQQLHDRIARLMNVEVCGLLLFEPENEVLASQLPFFGAPDSVISLFNIQVPAGSITHHLWLEREWWYSNDVLKDEMVGPLNMRGLAEAIGIRTAALVPMSIGNSRIGMLFVANKRDGGSFNDDDIRLLSIFAAQATIVVENANLYERERRYIAELASLQEMTQVAHGSAVQNLIAQITERIASLLQVEMCGILLYDQDTSPDEDRLGVLIAQSPFHGVDEESIRFYQIPVMRGSLFERLQADDDYWFSNDLAIDTRVEVSSFAQTATLVGM
ncbi:MAG: GAF domain-containing protein [Chloroflexi bacterium]|nr:GAF domain-containing protein [Chloroflexota bacterium]